jgi:thymidylate synthase
VYIPAKSLDDLLRKVFERLLKSKQVTKPSRGPATEIAGVMLKLANPRARLSSTEKKGTLFSCLGETMWYLAKSNDLKFITHYLPKYGENSDDNKTIYGAYGPRLFGLNGNNQVKNVIKLLRRKPDSRQAVIQLFDSADIASEHKDIPCTSTLQFMIRSNRLCMLTNMRSNDAFKGLPHDIFAFTMIQEIIARSLNVEIGFYKHSVGSLHLYSADHKDALKYIEEGWQSHFEMPPMPLGDPWPSIENLLKAEASFRKGKVFNFERFALPPFWTDIAHILQIHALLKKNDKSGVLLAKKQLSTGIYNPYIAKRQAKKEKQREAPLQLELLNSN